MRKPFVLILLLASSLCAALWIGLALLRRPHRNDVVPASSALKPIPPPAALPAQAQVTPTQTCQTEEIHPFEVKVRGVRVYSGEPADWLLPAPGEPTDQVSGPDSGSPYAGVQVQKTYRTDKGETVFLTFQRSNQLGGDPPPYAVTSIALERCVIERKPHKKQRSKSSQ